MNVYDPNASFKTEKQKAITEMWLRGDTAFQIGSALGISVQAVFRVRHALGLPKRSSSFGAKARWQEHKLPAKLNTGSKTPDEVLCSPVAFDVMVDGGGCRWPIGDNSPFLFCNNPRHEKGSYCKGHAIKSQANSRA